MLNIAPGQRLLQLDDLREIEVGIVDEGNLQASTVESASSGGDDEVGCQAPTNAQRILDALAALEGHVSELCAKVQCLSNNAAPVVLMPVDRPEVANGQPIDLALQPFADRRAVFEKYFMKNRLQIFKLDHK